MKDRNLTKKIIYLAGFALLLVWYFLSFNFLVLGLGIVIFSFISILFGINFKSKKMIYFGFVSFFIGMAIVFLWDFGWEVIRNSSVGEKLIDSVGTVGDIVNNSKQTYGDAIQGLDRLNNTLSR